MRRPLVWALLAAIVLAGCLQGVAPAAVRGDAMWREDLQRTGYVPDASVPSTVKLAWKWDGVNKGEHTAAKGSAVHADGKFIVGGDTGNVYAFEEDGRVAWAAATVPSNRGIHGTPAVHGGRVYIGAYDGAMYAFDLDDGDLLWRQKLGDWIGSSPLVHEGRLYIAVETDVPTGIFSVLDAATGRPIWNDTRLPTHPHSSIAIDPGRDLAVVGVNDGVLRAWDLSSRELAWNFTTGGDIKGPITLYEGRAFFGSWDENIYAVDLDSGEEVWRHETDGIVMSGAGVDPRTGTVYIGSHDGNVYALSADDGSVRWTAETGGRVMSSPTIAGDAVVVGSGDESIYAFDRETGETIWEIQADGEVSSSAEIAAGRIVFTTRADERPGKIYALESISAG